MGFRNMIFLCRSACSCKNFQAIFFGYLTHNPTPVGIGVVSYKHNSWIPRKKIIFFFFFFFWYLNISCKRLHTAPKQGALQSTSVRGFVKHLGKGDLQSTQGRHSVKPLSKGLSKLLCKSSMKHLSMQLCEALHKGLHEAPSKELCKGPM